MVLANVQYIVPLVCSTTRHSCHSPMVGTAKRGHTEAYQSDMQNRAEVQVPCYVLSPRGRMRLVHVRINS